MTVAELTRRIPLGQSSFEDLRSLGKIYVDKTELIGSLASDVSKIFLARPRRFGKTLLVSTFESLFLNGLHYFQGLSIEHFWKDEGKYNVLHLYFSRLTNFSNIEEFRFKLNDYLITAFEGDCFKISA